MALMYNNNLYMVCRDVCGVFATVTVIEERGKTDSNAIWAVSSAAKNRA